VADVCLPADARPETLRDVCRILLDVRRSLRGTARPERRQIPERDPAPRAETLSQLAAGVAHDFSDVLDVISGQAQLAQELLPAGHPARERLDLIFGASQRAAGLTRQLLALGREPQSQPEPLDFHDVVTSFARLLEHVIGAGVEVEMRRARTAGIVLADRAQIEQILLELALNALDATPRAGRLLFETADVDEAPASGEGSSPRPGPHVRLCVSSGGLGMNLETRQVFDRPGTSRQPAQEASLGLANVRRIVSECGGVVRLDGARGLGTVAVYLPRMVGLSSEAGPAPRDTPKEREGDPTSTRRHAAAS
jgi:signal transduction histidine kinase